ncbi:hypothetical protein [Oricola thermophila]|uniref:Uncharacterized protein n=1 Tax=Oricola thermophila TaxID=2742145 RepID=A0A6N1VA44_9HYPH|nr:hypothetical protein [Oricola thermophila]QKV17834.1 hypothetical protein HTY61_04860 [Oricola thermophila]
MSDQFIEPVYVPDVFISGIAYAEEVAPNVWRIAFYSEQRSGLDGTREKHIIAKAIMPRAVITDCIKGTAAFLGGKVWAMKA